MKSKISIIILFSILGLIFFDAAQQKYYLDEFDLSENEITFFQLLQNHFIRWLIWAVISLSIAYWNKRVFFIKEDLTLKEWGAVSGLMGIATGLSLILISFHSMYAQQLPLIAFGSLFKFFLFQKGLTFLMASTMLILLIFNRSRLQMIGEQEVEIANLKRTTSDLEAALKQDIAPHLNVKTGYKLHPIPLDHIIWIQSDDYCVKIHTESKSYTLRQSLKSLESKLAAYGFIRIHRTALLNMDHMGQINFDTAKIKLTNHKEIPYSKNGLKVLKERISDRTL